MAKETENYDDLYASDGSVHSAVSETEVLNKHNQQPDTQFLKGKYSCYKQARLHKRGQAVQYLCGKTQETSIPIGRDTLMRESVVDCKVQLLMDQETSSRTPGTGVHHPLSQITLYEFRYAEDIQLLKELGCNAFRLSLEWARIEPEKGKFDQDAIQRLGKYRLKRHVLNL